MNQPHFRDVKLKIEVICVVRDALWGVAACHGLFSIENPVWQMHLRNYLRNYTLGLKIDFDEKNSRKKQQKNEHPVGLKFF